LREPAEGLVADDQVVVARWRLAVFAPGDLVVGAVHPDRQHLDHYLPTRRSWIGHVLEAVRASLSRGDDHCVHDDAS
jgi:hypothetical protein